MTWFLAALLALTVTVTAPALIRTHAQLAEFDRLLTKSMGNTDRCIAALKIAAGQ